MIEDVLTLNPIKRAVYQRDVHFTEAIAGVLGAWPDTRSLAAFLWNHTAILLRPEAIVARRSRSIFPVLRAHGLIPVGARRIRLVPEQAALIWRYQANVMTRGHCLLLQRLLAAGPSIYVILRDHSQRKSAPAAGHVTYLKGPTLIRKRRPLHLRSLAGPAIANILSYIHASDDPADFLRELAILFPRKTFLDVLREAAAGRDCTGHALRVLDEAERNAPKDVLFGVSNPCDDDPDRKNWIDICQRARENISYVSGEVYDTSAALIPDDKRYLARLDDHLISADIGPGF